MAKTIKRKDMEAAFKHALEKTSGTAEIELVSYTAQEIRELCDTNPEHQASIDLREAVRCVSDSGVVNVSPLSVLAIRENRPQSVKHRMVDDVHPFTGKPIRVKRTFVELGDPQPLPAAPQAAGEQV